MEYTTEYLHFFSFFGAGLCFLLSINQLVLIHKTLFNFILSLLLFLLALMQFILGAIFSGLGADFPIIISIAPSLLCLLAPTFYTLEKMIILDRKKVSINELYHFIPFILSILIELIYIFEIYVRDWLNLSFHFTTNINEKLNVVFLLSTLYFVVYNFIFLKYISSGYKDKNVNIIVKSIFFFVFPGRSSILIVLLLAYMTKILFFAKLATFLMTFLIIIAYILSERYPDTFITIPLEIRKNKYERSLLTGLNLDQLKVKLDLLMNKEKIFLEEDLNLKSLAKKLNITGHQLSQYLNETLNQNFSIFINQYRIKEAAKIIISEPDRSIISIIYQVGYNSKSTFNSAFLKIMGVTPQKYRLDHNSK